MSILIRGMEIPTCMTCPCCEEKLYGNLCRITNEIVSFSFYRGDKCPLIEIPPHGDLIDKQVADELNKKDYEAMGSDRYTDYARSVVLNCLNAAPIIIESEVDDGSN